MVFSDGEKREPISRLTKIEKKIARLNKSLSRKEKNSENFKKNVKKLNRLYARIVDTK
jgi:transposase